MPEPSGAEGDVGRWLVLLRDGSEEEQQRARTELGLILEARGMLDDAAEAYERNVAAGVADRRPYERLAALARARDDRAAEARALRALADLLVPPALELPAVSNAEEVPPAATDDSDATTSGEAGASVAPPIIVVLPEAAVDPADAATAPAISPSTVLTDGSVGLEDASEGTPTPAVVSPEGASDTPDAPSDGVPDTSEAPLGAAPETLEAPLDAIADTSEAPLDAAPGTLDAPADATELVALADAATLADPEPAPEPSTTAEPEKPARVRSRKQEDEDPGIALHHVLEMHPEESHHHPPHRSQRPVGPGTSRTLVTLALLVPVLVVIVGATLGWPGTPDAGSAVPPIGSLAATAALSPQPTIELRLIAGTPSPQLALTKDGKEGAPTAVQSPTSTETPTVTPVPLAARCADAGLRFPETRDAEGAVRTAYREYLSRQGVTIDASSSLFVGLGEAYAARHDEVVAGWMAVTLQREQRGLPSFPLADYVASDVVVATGPGEYQLRATISPQGWSEVRAWPAETCEGAFMRSPANAQWVDLMQASVGDITWALPTRQPTR